jgi:hypothetical protein
MDMGTIHQVLIVIFALVGELVVTLKHSIATTNTTLQNFEAMAYLRECLISFFSVCRYKKYNTFDDGYLVFADVTNHLLTT